MLNIFWVTPDALAPNRRNVRTHSHKQIRQIADSIAAFGFLVPILVDEGHAVIAGHGRYAAAKLLGLQQVPVIEVQGLSEAKRRALALADNKIAANAGLRWVHIAQVVGSIDDPKLLVASSEVENLLALRKDNERGKSNFCANGNNFLLRILHRPSTAWVG